MKRLLFLLGLVGALCLLPTVSFGADGDECVSSANADIPVGTRGTWQVAACVQVCDAKNATEECAEYDFSNSPGIPDILIFEYEDSDNSCSSTVDITISTGHITGGTPSYTLDVSAVVLTEATGRIILITEDYPPDRFLFFSTADDADCDDLDVRMFMYNRKKGLF